MSGKIVVVGSSNTDLTIKMNKLPKLGETVIGKDYVKSLGGKGANQAVATARAGASVTFITKMGNDEFGNEALKSFDGEGINTKNILIDEKSKSGLAMIWVDSDGENSIAVASGANANLSAAEIIEKSDEIKSASILLTQLEIPFETVKSAIDIAHQNNVRVILNPAPAYVLPEDLLAKINIITPNIYELETLTGVKSNDANDIKYAAKLLHSKGIEQVIVTCGSKGSYLFNKNEFVHLPPFSVDAVDTTAAGDILNGAFAAALLENKTIKEALVFASAAAAISVTQMGAQISAPHKNQILEFLAKRSMEVSLQ
ncbi:MAG: ribokinase [Bacteroidota bacterium]